MATNQDCDACGKVAMRAAAAVYLSGAHLGNPSEWRQRSTAGITARFFGREPNPFDMVTKQHGDSCGKVATRAAAAAA